MKFLHYLGSYFLFLRRVFSKPENPKMFYRQLKRDMFSLGVDSIVIVSIISLFIGAVIAIQSAYNTDKPFIPTYLVGWMTRDSMLIEFSSTVVALILAGKVGSHISSEIGAMRVTGQIDVLDIMGINSASYITLPKITASLLFNPFLMLMSMAIGIFGGFLAVKVTNIIPSESFLFGLKYAFNPFYIMFSLIKFQIFTFVITSVASYQGYNVEGGSLEVGKSSTQAVVYSSVAILFLDLVITQMLMS